MYAPGSGSARILTAVDHNSPLFALFNMEASRINDLCQAVITPCFFKCLLTVSRNTFSFSVVF